MPHLLTDLPADLDLSLLPTGAPDGHDKGVLKQASDRMAAELASLQELLYANRQHSLPCWSSCKDWTPAARTAASSRCSAT